MDTKDIGILGEKIAENYLTNKGYKILARNYVPKFVSGPLRGEIDIIAKQKDLICFVEVKTLSQIGGGIPPAFLPEDRVGFQKQRKIMKIAESWLMEKKIPLNSKWQIDVVAIKIDLNNRKAKIRHFKNAVF